MLAPVHHILPLTAIVRERSLPVPGSVSARMGQKVNAADVIAQAGWAREHVLLDVGRMMRLTPSEAERHLKCKPGDKLEAGAVIAAKGGRSGVVRAPRAGRVAVVGGGQVLLEVGETRLELRAGIPGTVTQIIAERGAIIETAGGLVQCMWGNGRIDTGLLVNLAERPDSVLTAERLDVSLRGSVILAGMLRDAATLQAAAELPVRGLIISSIPAALIAAASEVRYPIVATDGFGLLPMNSAAHKLLSTSARREVTLNAEAYDRYSGARPEVIIPLPVSQPPPAPNEYQSFVPGQQVRMRRPPAAGSIGTLVMLRPGLSILASGLRAPAALVKIENGDTVIVPLVNLEVVG